MQGQPGFQNFGQQPAPPPVQQAADLAKKDLRRDVMKTVLLLIGLQVAANILSVVALLALNIVTVLSGGTPQADSTSLVTTFFTGYLPIMLTEIGVILVACKILAVPFSRVVGHNRMDKGFTALGALGCIGVGVVGQLCSMFFLTFLQLLHYPLYTASLEVDWSQPAGSVLLLLYVCLLGPILEELIFRGFILKALQRHGVSFAVIFSAVLFTLFHQNVAQIFVPFLLGIFLALIAIRSGSIVPSILAHIANNTIAMVLDMVLPKDNLALYWVGYIIYAAIFLGIGAIFLILYLKELTPILKWRSPILKLRTQLGSAFSHWSTIVLFGLYVLMLLYMAVIAFVQARIY